MCGYSSGSIQNDLSPCLSMRLVAPTYQSRCPRISPLGTDQSETILAHLPALNGRPLYRWMPAPFVAPCRVVVELLWRRSATIAPERSPLRVAGPPRRMDLSHLSAPVLGRPLVDTGKGTLRAAVSAPKPDLIGDGHRRSIAKDLCHTPQESAAAAHSPQSSGAV